MYVNFVCVKIVTEACAGMKNKCMTLEEFMSSVKKVEPEWMASSL